MRLIADKAYRYGGKPLEVGDEFEANSRDARALVAVGRAHAADDVGAKPSAKPAPKPAKKPAKKRTYKRRDLQAEE